MTQPAKKPKLTAAQRGHLVARHWPGGVMPDGLPLEHGWYLAYAGVLYDEPRFARRTDVDAAIAGMKQHGIETYKDYDAADETELKRIIGESMAW